MHQGFWCYRTGLALKLNITIICMQLFTMKLNFQNWISLGSPKISRDFITIRFKYRHRFASVAELKFAMLMDSLLVV